MLTQSPWSGKFQAHARAACGEASGGGGGGERSAILGGQAAKVVVVDQEMEVSQNGGTPKRLVPIKMDLGVLFQETPK